MRMDLDVRSAATRARRPRKRGRLRRHRARARGRPAVAHSTGRVVSNTRTMSWTNARATAHPIRPTRWEMVPDAPPTRDPNPRPGTRRRRPAWSRWRQHADAAHGASRPDVLRAGDERGLRFPGLRHADRHGPRDALD